jgi:hypothetical protein
MSLDPSPRRRELGQDKEPRYRGWLPRELLPCDAGAKSRLLIMLPKCLLDARELSLDLDDEQGAGVGMPSEDVDRAALAIDCIGHFQPELPARLRQQVDDRADQARVTFVEQSIEVTASPSKLDEQVRVEHARDGSHLGERNLLQVTALHQRHDTLRHACAPSHINLAPTEAVTQRAESRADSDVHVATVRARPYSPITQQAVSSYPKIVESGGPAGRVTGRGTFGVSGLTPAARLSLWDFTCQIRR